MHIFAKFSHKYSNNMQNIQRRQQAIAEIIASRPILNQDELLKALGEAGIETTQATLSRDLKTLRISKVQGEGYKLPPQDSPRSIHTPLGQGIVSLDISGQMAVIKTHPGFAGAVASLVDRHTLPGVMGTIAGDDTVLMVLREKTDSKALMKALSPIINEPDK